ncbi:MAG: NAD(P)-dependent alcohol dehydrogenase [Gammaproteobacteria bacterium]|nr:NAD(P)-dependent alcohol dehydrogenase [Gammaproteobacteria bacterium]
MSVTAAVAQSAGAPFTFEEVELGELRADEVRVRIAAVGICHTDVAVKEQSVKLPLPMVLGHEGSGVVEEVGSAIRHLAPGDHVVLSGDSCGECRRCHAGLPSYCDEFVERNLTGYRTDGTSPLHSRDQGGEALRGRFCGQSSFATQAIAPGRSAIKIPSDLPLELMGPLGCGLTTGVGTVMNALKPAAGASIAVFGVGTVGLSAVMGARLSGCETIIAVDMHAARLEMAEGVGATAVINAGSEDVVAAILGLTSGGADFSVECSGNPLAVEQAIACLGRPGWCAQVGAPPGGTKVPLDMDHLGFGRGIRGVVLGEANPQNFVPYLAALYRDGRLPFDRFVKYYDFADINQAVHDSAVTGEVIKPVLRMS